MPQAQFQGTTFDALVERYADPYGGPAVDDKQKKWSCGEAFGHKMLSDWRATAQDFCVESESSNPKTRMVCRAAFLIPAPNPNPNPNPHPQVCHPTTLFDRDFPDTPCRIDNVQAPPSLVVGAYVGWPGALPHLEPDPCCWCRWCGGMTLPRSVRRRGAHSIMCGPRPPT